MIGVPFEWVGMDLVRLLPKSSHGQEYILMIIDYTTHYPEAVPLQEHCQKNVQLGQDPQGLAHGPGDPLHLQDHGRSVSVAAGQPPEDLSLPPPN